MMAGVPLARLVSGVRAPVVAWGVLSACLAFAMPSQAPRRHLLIVVDGLRPDAVTADVMPHLTALDTARTRLRELERAGWTEHW